MFINFFGAAREVTGSCNLLEIEDKKVLVDCGMFQGSDFNEQKNHDPLPFDPKELSAVIITHAHLDHVGRLPLLTKDGFDGPIFATPPTVELAELILNDALDVMEYNARKFGKSILYDSTDVADVISLLKPVDYHQVTPLFFQSDLIKNKSVPTFTFYDAGHIFGSAFVEINALGKRIVFSGDIGNTNVPILRDTESLPPDVDLLVCESTYGDRLHETIEERQAILENDIYAAVHRGGVLMIPAFSLERTQELLYDLNDLVDRKKKMSVIPIFLDSPLAIHATNVYRKYHQYYNEEAEKLFSQGDDLFQFSGLTMCETKNDSKKINQTPGAKIIIAGSGMMNGGRIVHHALRYLSDEKNTLLIIGYQAANTLGRKILDGESPVEIMGEKVAVHCQVKAIGAFSAHGDQDKLLDWVGGGKTVPKKVLLNHGEPTATTPLAKRLTNDLGIKATPVNYGLRVEVK